MIKAFTFLSRSDLEGWMASGALQHDFLKINAVFAADSV